MQKVKKAALFVGFALFAIAFAFVAHWMEFGPVKIFRYYALVCVTAYLAVTDLRHRIVPNQILLGLAGLRLVCFVPEAVLYREHMVNFFWSALLGSLLGMAILGMGNLLCRGGMGFGDIKYVGAAGLYLGPNGILAVLFFSLLFSAVYCGVMLLAKKLGAKDEIPLMPFLFAGLLVTCLLGI